MSKFCTETMRKLFVWLNSRLHSTSAMVFYFLGHWFLRGIGCEKDLNLARGNYLNAGELGHVGAAVDYGRLLDESDSARWLWRGRAALRGRPGLFLYSFSKQVDLFFSGYENASIVFMIGRALNGNIDMEKKKIFGPPHALLVDFDSLIEPANQALSFFSFQTKLARLAVDTWTLIATRLHVIKDMRIFIGKMIWEGRFEANYKIDNAPAPLASPDRKRFRKYYRK